MNYINEFAQSLISDRKEYMLNSVMESFGDYCSEESVRVRNMIKECSNSCSYDTMTSIINTINETSLSDVSKQMLTMKAFEVYSESAGLNIVDEAMEKLFDVKKFSGDPAKNRQYIDLLKEMEKFVMYLADSLQGRYELADEMLEIITAAAESAQTKEDIQKCMSDLLNRIDKGNTKFDARTYNSYIDKLKEFEKISKTFNNKYSKITMQEKKIIDKRFDKIIADIADGPIKDWIKFVDLGNDNVKTRQILDAYEKLKQIDRDAAVILGNRTISNLFEYLYEGWHHALGGVNYMRRILGIEVENTKKWKIVHTVFKK